MLFHGYRGSVTACQSTDDRCGQPATTTQPHPGVVPQDTDDDSSSIRLGSNLTSRCDFSYDSHNEYSRRNSQSRRCKT